MFPVRLYSSVKMAENESLQHPYLFFSSILYSSHSVFGLYVCHSVAANRGQVAVT